MSILDNGVFKKKKTLRAPSFALHYSLSLNTEQMNFEHIPSICAGVYVALLPMQNYCKNLAKTAVNQQASIVRDISSQLRDLKMMVS